MQVKILGRIARLGSLAIPWMIWPAIAQAQTATTMGSVVQTFAQNFLPATTDFLVSLAYIAGAYLVFAGLLKLKGFGSNARSPVQDGFVRIICGSFLLALPSTMGMGVESLLEASYFNSNVSSTTVGSVTDCLSSTSGSTSSVPLTCMAENVATNFVPAMIEMIFGICVFSGLFLILHGLYRAAQSHNEGQHVGQQYRGWKLEMLIGFVIANVPILMSDIESTLGITSGTITSSGFVGANTGSSLFSYTPSTSSTMLTQYSTLISYLFIILTLFGVISFVQGWFILKSHADGSGRKTIMGAWTHIGSGVLLANAKVSTCWIVGTLLGSGLGFCS